MSDGHTDPILTGTDATPGDPDEPTPAGVIRSISGHSPLLTGTTCDSCNAGLAPGDRVLVALDHHDCGGWQATRTHCVDCGLDAREFGPTNAVARCDLGHDVGGGFAPLYNPDVMAFAEPDS